MKGEWADAKGESFDLRGSIIYEIVLVLTFIVLYLILLGFGYALFSSSNTNAIMTSVEKRYYGIAMLLFALFISRAQITPEYYSPFVESIKAAFMIFSVLCFIGIFASMARGKLH